jgi:hypothetical protein
MMVNHSSFVAELDIINENKLKDPGFASQPGKPFVIKKIIMTKKFCKILALVEIYGRIFCFCFCSVSFAQITIRTYGVDIIKNSSS